MIGAGGNEELAGRGSAVVVNDHRRGRARPTLVALAWHHAGWQTESLVIGGRLVTDAAAPGQLVPIDSEHSAIL